jgi:hypothetical protein
MGKQTKAYKQRWESENYKQIKISVRRGLAAAFKADCEVAGVSMAGEISAFMSERLGQRKEIADTARYRPGAPSGNDTTDFSSKGKRRAAVKKILSQLEMIRDAQSAALENTPENLQGSEAYEDAEESLALIEEAACAVLALAEIY